MDVKPAPALDVVAPTPAPVTAGIGAASADDSPKAETTKHHTKDKAAKPAVAKQRDGNVVAAIVASVIIVLGLAALTVFAYLKQTGHL